MVKYVYWAHVVLELFLIFRVLKISGKEFYIVFQRTKNSIWHSQIGLLRIDLQCLVLSLCGI